MKSDLDRVIVALDTSDLNDAERLMDTLSERTSWYKVGFELFSAVGPAAVLAVIERDNHVFLDLKLHDIPVTVAQATRVCARLHVDFLTAHTVGGSAMLRAASLVARESMVNTGFAPSLLGVTVLTSLDRKDLDAIGLAPGVPMGDLVVALGKMAVDSGCGGLVAAGSDVSALREALGPGPTIVTPGVRPGWAGSHDQKRVVTPATALSDGADYVVVGRTVTAAADPAGAFDRLME